jgi:hypothetical protein
MKTLIVLIAIVAAAPALARDRRGLRLSYRL